MFDLCVIFASNFLCSQYIELHLTFVSKEKVAFEWSKLEAKIQKKQTAPKRKVQFLQPLRIAASIALLVSLGFYFLSGSPKITHETHFGEILKIKLPLLPQIYW